MKFYQAIRISVGGRATYGDKYGRIASNNEYKHNDIVEIGNEKFLILFEEEQNDGIS